MNRREVFLVENYDYLVTICFKILYLLPPFIRPLFFKIIFRSYGKNVLIGQNCHFHYPWKIEIGNHVSIGGGAKFFPSYQIKDAFIVIEDNVMIAPNLCIFGAGHPTDNPLNQHVADQVLIKMGAYIGGNVTIRYGVTIGTGAVVAAGSVVVKDVPDYQIVGGNPAKVISSRNQENGFLQ